MPNIATITHAASHADGIQVAASATEKLAFHGASPVVQPASADQAAVAADPSNAELATLANALRAALVSHGLIKGSA